MKQAISILLALLMSFPLLSQERDRFDYALDQYESICNRCIVLRNAMERGEQVPQSDMDTLVEQLSTLKKTLSEASGEMTPAQKQRFESIKDRFLTSGQSRIPSLEELPFQVNFSTTYSPVVHPSKAIPMRQPLQPFILGGAGLSAHPDIAVMVGVQYGKAGGYLSARIRPVSGGYDYECASDGKTSYGYVWTSGVKHFPGAFFTAGAFYCLKGPWNVYAGAGYGKTEVLWEDIDGKNVRVSDLSLSGLAVESGVLYFKGHLALGAGLSTLKFRQFFPVVCAGYRF